MSVGDVFVNVSKRLVEGMMFHDDMADYFDFLGLMGFKRMHEYAFVSEAANMRGIHRYFINHYNSLLEGPAIIVSNHIPIMWYNKSRKDVDPDSKRNAIQTCVEKWVEWERDTKKIYENAYCELCDLGEVASACKIKELVCCVDYELKIVDRIHIELNSTNYDMTVTFFMQDPLHEEYKEKTKSVGVDIC